jgi:ABC-type multidrug transport system fused ATPase/permease subunit
MMLYRFQSKKWVHLKEFIASNRALFFAVLFYGIFANILMILIPISISKYYSLIFEVSSRRAFILGVFPDQWVNTLPNFLWFFLCLIFFWMGFSFLQKYVTGILGERFAKSIREALFAHQLGVQMKDYNESGFGKYLLRYSGDMNSIRNYLTNGIISFIIDFLLVLFAIIAMIFTDVYLTIVVICGITIALLTVFLLNKSLYSVSLSLRNKKSGLLSFVSSRLPLMLTIKGFNRQHVEEKDFNERSEKVYSLGVKYQRVNNIIGVLVPGILYLTLCTILLTIYLLKSNNAHIQGEHLLGFILLFMTVLPVFRRLLRVSSIWKVGNISFDKLQGVMDLKTEISAEEEGKFKFKNGSIRFKHVSFAYSKGVNILDDFNLKIEGGTTLVIYSAKGLPKTTLIKLISGIYHSDKGVISIDGQAIEELDKKSLRKKIAILSDDFSLLGDTVFEASSYSKANIRRIEVEQMFDELQKGIPEDSKVVLDFKIGDRGHKLTEFQRQLVVCARCFLTEKSVIIIESLSKFSNNPGFQNILSKLKYFQEKDNTIILLEDNYFPFYDLLNPEKIEY